MFGKKVVADMISRSAENEHDRRSFLRAAGVAGLGTVGAVALSGTTAQTASATNPSDPTQYLAQISQMSAVQQGILTNTKLDSMLTQSSLAQADSRITNLTGRSEIAFEAMKARGLRRHTEPDYSVMAQYVADCRVGGIDFATYRRLAELVRERDQRALRDAVSHRWPTSDVDALWRVPGL